MHHPLRMRVGERVGDLGNGARGFPEIRPALLQVGQQAPAGKQRGDDVAVLAFDAGVEHGDDARMLQAGELARFLDEDRVTFRGVGSSDVRDLDRDRPLQLAVEPLVHGREAPAPDRPANHVAAEPAWPRTLRCIPPPVSGAHGGAWRSAGRTA